MRRINYAPQTSRFAASLPCGGAVFLLYLIHVVRHAAFKMISGEKKEAHS